MLKSIEEVVKLEKTSLVLFYLEEKEEILLMEVAGEILLSWWYPNGRHENVEKRKSNFEGWKHHLVFFKETKETRTNRFG